jgi:outer membrane murein-binding lipoprotein Lpp
LLEQGYANDALKQKYFDDMTEAEHVHQQELEIQAEKHESAIRSMQEEHERDKQIMMLKHQDEQNALKREHEEHVRSLRTQMQELNETIEKLESEREDMISDHREAITKADEEARALREEVAYAEEQRRYAHGRYMALKGQRGLLTAEDDFTSKEKFKELELEMAAYKKMFKEQWRLTKSKIRRKIKQEIYVESEEEAGEKELE